MDLCLPFLIMNHIAKLLGSGFFFEKFWQSCHYKWTFLSVEVIRAFIPVFLFNDERWCWGSTSTTCNFEMPQIQPIVTAENFVSSLEDFPIELLSVLEIGQSLLFTTIKRLFQMSWPFSKQRKQFSMYSNLYAWRVNWIVPIRSLQHVWYWSCYSRCSG